MKTSIALVLGSLAATCLGGYPTKLEPCSSTSSTPCQCPKGTQLLECVTVGVIGAEAPVVEKLMNDFFNITWQLGAKPYKTKGRDNTVGAVRSVKYPIVPSGIEDVDERLTSYHVSKDGSFKQEFEQVQKKIPYPDGNGYFAGFWGTISGERRTDRETIVTFSNYACETAHIRSFKGFHEEAIGNATEILQKAGLITGYNAAPVSAQSF